MKERMSRFQLPKMNLNNHLLLRHPCVSHGYQLVVYKYHLSLVYFLVNIFRIKQHELTDDIVCANGTVQSARLK